MRRVQVLRLDKAYQKQVAGERWFHQWVVVSELDGNGAQRRVVAAILEDDNGNITFEEPDYVRFKDKPVEGMIRGMP